MKKLFFAFSLAGAVALVAAASNCTGSPKCGPNNCTGCCSSTGICQSGNTSNACGLSGQNCAACTGSQVCQTGVCTNAGGGCNPATCNGCCNGNSCVASCPTGYACQAGTCQVSGNDGGGAGQYGGFCGTCTAPYQCLSLAGTGGGGLCTELCDAGTDCPANSTCFSFGNLAACLLTCTGSCFTGDVCEQVGPSQSVCIPDCRQYPTVCATGEVCNSSGNCVASGSQQFGQACSQTVGACALPNQCLVFSSTDPQGFCTQTCTPDGGPGGCPSSPAGAACDLTGGTGGSYYCGFPCAGPDAGCPAGLTCQLVQSPSYYFCH